MVIRGIYKMSFSIFRLSQFHSFPLGKLAFFDNFPFKGGLCRVFHHHKMLLGSATASKTKIKQKLEILKFKLHLDDWTVSYLKTVVS